MTKMSFVDILGFANIVGTEIMKDEDFEDYIARLIVDFQKLPRSKRRQLIKLAADVVGANQDIKKQQESHNSSSD